VRSRVFYETRETESKNPVLVSLGNKKVVQAQGLERRDDMKRNVSDPRDLVSRFRLRICEVVTGGSWGRYIFRFDFIGFMPDDQNPLIAGATSMAFSATDNPRDVTKILRRTADALDDYWALAFPGAISKGGDPMAKKPKGKPKPKPC